MLSNMTPFPQVPRLREAWQGALVFFILFCNGVIYYSYITYSYGVVIAKQ